jgi:hypothetical protein
MNGPFNPLVIAQAVARNIVPLVGIVAFHRSAGNVLILYLLDTLLAMTVIIAGLASSLSPPSDVEGIGARSITRQAMCWRACFSPRSPRCRSACR